MCSVPGRRTFFIFANSTQSKKKQSYQSMNSHIPYHKEVEDCNDGEAYTYGKLRKQ